ncbi:hypothetical protein BAY61_21830 [Prauserella marina]|uniref:Uncharacterized protein n=1 Tax=Prauserella marina TaxID=530584 RepID=A0A222VTD8_9PSEU|nr:hypothetical protein [Prauserella marina]ASR37197.1 hypothetical protein BAY61_21830 [Prauserella marina]PWV72511.1 hypothetical protein DES30_110110 [Prauserella marina]SDD78302.1 hypothetical protein SAMN05421630_112128 [Prauserella marina]
MNRSFLSPAARWSIATLAIVALLPYTVLKLLWLGGSRIGMVPGSGTGNMQDARMEIGNLITVVLVVIGAIVVLALTQSWGQRLPWWVLVIPAAAATGALAPIALGLPVGAVLQAVTEGNVNSGGEGNLTGPVFAFVYGGFGVFGVALAILFADYVQRRWSPVLAEGPRPPSQWGARALAAVCVIPFACAMIFWAFASEGMGLAGWESLAQRVVLVVAALLALLGCAALLAQGKRVPPRPRWLAGWLGCCTTAVQGPVMLLLAYDATVDAVLVVVTVLATPAAAWLGLSAIRRTNQAVSEAASR